MNRELLSSTRSLQANRKLENLLRDLCGFTTTHNNNQHKTYTHHQQLSPSLQPPTTTTTTTNITNQHQPNQLSHLPRACVLALCACAWVRPLGCIWATSASDSQPAQPAQPATQRHSDSQRSPASSPAHQPLRNTSAISPPSKQAHRLTMPAIQPARRYLVCGNYSLIDSL